MIGNYTKIIQNNFSIKNIMRIKNSNFRNLNTLNAKLSLKQFSSGGHAHGHGHGHDAAEDSNYHQRKYDRVSYNKKLSNAEREK